MRYLKDLVFLLAVLSAPVAAQENDADATVPALLGGPVTVMDPGNWAGHQRTVEINVASMSLRRLGLPEGDGFGWRGDAWPIPGGRFAHLTNRWNGGLCVHAGGSGSAIVAQIGLPGVWQTYPAEGSRWVDGLGLVILDSICWTMCDPRGWRGQAAVWDGQSSQARLYPVEDTIPRAVELLPGGNTLAVIDGYSYSASPDPPTGLIFLDLASGQWSRASGPIHHWPQALAVHGNELWVSSCAWKWPGQEWTWHRNLHAFDARTRQYLGTRSVIPDPGPCGDTVLRGFGRRTGDPSLYARDLTGVWKFDATGRVIGSFYVSPVGCSFWGPYQLEYDDASDMFVGQVNIATGYGPYYLWLVDPQMQGVCELEEVPYAVGRIARRL